MAQAGQQPKGAAPVDALLGGIARQEAKNAPANAGIAKVENDEVTRAAAGMR
jgi:hypothetical protein